MPQVVSVRLLCRPPLSDYAKTKLAAEQALAETSRATGLRYTILRPPMVYGPAASGNFARLTKLARSGIPLPLAGAIAPKSFIFVDNLASAVVSTAAQTPPSTSNAFLLSDGHDTSTADLIREIAIHCNASARLFHVSQSVLRPAFLAFRLREEWEKLYTPFVVDMEPFSEWADRTPPVPFREAVRLSVGETRPRVPCTSPE